VAGTLIFFPLVGHNFNNSVSVFVFGNGMNNCLSNSLLSVLLASTFLGAADAAKFAPVSSATRLNGLLSGASNESHSPKAFASPNFISQAAAEGIGVASRQVEAWLEEIPGAAGPLTLAGAAVLALRRRRRARNHRLQTLYEIADMPETLSKRQTPRCLPNNPYLDASAPEVLSRQIENAAEASVEFGRVFGVIYFDLGPRPPGDFSDEARAWEADHSELMEKLRKALRNTDHVAKVSHHEIIACIALLPGRSELVGIAERLRKMGQNSPRFANAFMREAGLAIYPACGYRGEELIDYARSDFHFPKPPRMAYLPPNASQLEGVADPKT
jgi:hypothetical protein